MIEETTPSTYPYAIKLDNPIPKKIIPYKFDPVLCPNTNCANEGPELNTAPIQRFARKTYITYISLVLTVNLIVEKTMISMRTTVNITLLYPVLLK